jgi:hypothetical protein
VLRLFSIVKFITPSEAETKGQKAVEFLRRIGQNDDSEELPVSDKPTRSSNALLKTKISEAGSKL